MNDPFCHCTGEHCQHHRIGELCPNDPIPPISHMIDLKTGTPIAGTACGLGEECWRNQAESK
jgi:hypothetical protein